MQNQKPGLDVQPEDWEPQPSEPVDLGAEDRISIARVDERIRAVRAQLIPRDERMTRIEKDIDTVKNDLEKDIDTVKNDLEKDILELKNNHNRLVNRLWWGIGIFVTSLVAIIIALISTGKLKIM